MFHCTIARDHDARAIVYTITTVHNISVLSPHMRQSQSARSLDLEAASMVSKNAPGFINNKCQIRMDGSASNDELLGVS